MRSTEKGGERVGGGGRRRRRKRKRKTKMVESIVQRAHEARPN
jgi:hypothetical protein